MAKSKSNLFVLVNEADQTALSSIKDAGPVWTSIRPYPSYLNDKHEFMTFETESSVKKMINQLGLSTGLCSPQEIVRKTIWEYKF